MKFRICQLLAIIAFSLMASNVSAGFFRDLWDKNQESEQTPQGETSDYHEITVDNRLRQYTLYRPSSVDAQRPLPLVIALHGTFGSGESMRENQGFDPYADKDGFMVVYPEAFRKARDDKKNTRWNDGRGTLESSKLGVDDVAFIKAMIEDIARQVPLDRSRIYATGPSNGGIMTYRLACELKGTFAAIAPVIASIPVGLRDSCHPESGLSILSLNGTADPIVPLDGGTICSQASKRFCEGGESIPVKDSVAKFASANKCQTSPVSEKLPPREDDGTWVERQTYKECTGGTEVVSYLVHGMGHVWPPRSHGVLSRSLGETSNNLDATQVIVEFFLKHHR